MRLLWTLSRVGTMETPGGGGKLPAEKAVLVPLMEA